MKVLFLSVTAGNGHNSCANAIDKCLKDRGIETYILDIYGYVNKMLGKTVSEIYSFGISKAPKIYGTIYNMEEDAKLSIGAVMDNINRLATKKIYEFIKENEIDTIITTHVFGGQLITRLKRKKKIDIFSVGVVTDYTIHPHWEKTNLDYYVIADEGLSRQCVEKGIPEKKLLPIGIPLDTKYSVKRDKKEMKKRLGFNPEKNLVFIIMGSMGYGNIFSVIKQIDKTDVDVNVAVCCGNNKRAKSLVDRSAHKKNFTTYGFISNVDRLMDAADCIITKPGGLSVTESLSKKLPMIFVDPIPGQEYRNVEFLVNNGVGLYTTKSFTVEDALNIYFNDSERRTEIKSAVERLSKPDAVKNIGDFVISMEKE